jgi:hypothetical protein
MGIPLGISTSPAGKRWYYRFRVPIEEAREPFMLNAWFTYPSLMDFRGEPPRRRWRTFKLTFGSKDDAILAKLHLGY